MPQPIELELKTLLQAVAIASPTSFSFADTTYTVSPAPVMHPSLALHPMPPNPLVRDLQSILYSYGYCRRPKEAPPATPTPVAALTEFVTALSRANATAESWDPGWQIYQTMPNGQIYVQKGTCQRSAMPGEYITSAGPGIAPQQGLTVTLRIAREAPTTETGFYFIYSQTLSDIWDEHHLVRIYFHVSAEGARPLMEHVSRVLNRYQVAFRMKTLSDPAQYDRADAAVLYFARRRFPIVARVLAELPARVHATLRPATPLFSKELLPGIGLAEDPNTGESFGMNRCRIVAEAIVDAWAKGDQSPDGRMRAVDSRFRAYGMRLDACHLNAGSFDSYELPAPLKVPA